MEFLNLASENTFAAASLSREKADSDRPSGSITVRSVDQKPHLPKISVHHQQGRTWPIKTIKPLRHTVDSVSPAKACPLGFFEILDELHQHRAM